MSEDLKRLLAEQDVARLLSRHELSTLRAAATGGVRSVALLHGIPEAGAQRQVDAVKAKLEAAANGRPSAGASRVSAGAASTPPTSQAPRPSGGSTAAAGGPSREERVRAFLRDHSQATVKDMEATGLVRSSLYEVVRELVRKGEIHDTGRGGRSSAYALGPGPSTAELEDRATREPPSDAQLEREREAQLEREIDAAGERVAATAGLGYTTGATFEAPEVGLEAGSAVRRGDAARLMLQLAGVTGDAVAAPRVFIGLWDVLLADGEDWTPEHTHAYVAAARELYAAYGGEA